MMLRRKDNMGYKKTYELAVVTGTYQDRMGNEKKRWQNVGLIIENEEGKKMILVNRTFNPAGVPHMDGTQVETVTLSMFPPKERNADRGAAASDDSPTMSAEQVKQRVSRNPKPPAEDFGDNDIPF